MATNDRVEMSLDQVIKKDWKDPKGGSRGDTKAATPSAPRGKVAAFGKAVLGRGKGGKGGKAAGRGLVRRNPIMTKVRRAPVKGASKSKGKAKGNVRWVPKGEAIRNDREMSRGKGKGRSEGKSIGKGKSSGKSTGKSSGKSGKSSGKSTQRFGMRLWRGATTRPTNAEVTRGPKGKSKGKGKSLGKSSNLLRVNRNQTFVKKSTKGLSKGKKGGGKSLAVSTYSSKGQGSYSKGKSKGKSYDSGYGSGRNGSSYGGSYGGSGYGGGYGGGGGWGQGYDNYYKGKGSRESSPRASDQLTPEDKRMMKKITVVAQLDKVPKPHPAMQGLRKRSTGGDTGALSSRFAANFRR